MSLSNSLISVGGAFGVVLAGVAIAALGYPGLGVVSGGFAIVTKVLAQLLAGMSRSGVPVDADRPSP